jgi:hypothetical protein
VPEQQVGQLVGRRPAGQLVRWRWVAPIAAALVGVAEGAGAVVLVQNQ